jgi:hypothetical protein
VDYPVRDPRNLNLVIPEFQLDACHVVPNSIQFNSLPCVFIFTQASHPKRTGSYSDITASHRLEQDIQVETPRRRKTRGARRKQ